MTFLEHLHTFKFQYYMHKEYRNTVIQLKIQKITLNRVKKIDRYKLRACFDTPVVLIRSKENVMLGLQLIKVLEHFH